MLHQAATLNSSVSLGDAIKRLEIFTDDVLVVVRRRKGQEQYWYQYRVGDIRDLALRPDSYWADKLDAKLGDALNLREYKANRTVQVSEGSAEEGMRDNGVLLDGETVLGILEPEAMASADGDSGSAQDDASSPAGPRGRDANPPPLEREISFEAVAGGGTTDDTEAFAAYPRLHAPDGVQFDTMFHLTVGLTSDQLTPTTAPIVVPNAPKDEFNLLVQVIAAGFKAPSGTHGMLRVERNDLSANQVIFDLVADEEPNEPRRHTLEVQFSFNGNPCGRAWRDITVVPRSGRATDVPHAKEGSSPISTPGGSNAPDLTISITEADEDGHFVWLFTSPHSVNLHDDRQIETRLDNHNARSFAAQVLKGIPGKDGTAQVGMHMAGAARQIADAMPTEFWLVLGEVWAAVHAGGKVPRLLFLSAEPYVPWELASVEDAYIDPVLIDARYPMVLNAQAAVGRWLPPRPRTPRGGERPAQPPAARVGVSHMAVVTGDYLAINGIRPLPEADEEGKFLTSQYQAIPLTATWSDVESLLQNRIQRNGQAVDIQLMHFACHGQVDLANPAHNGIVLNSGNMRLDPTTARGNTIGAATQPFAFMNACEVGMAGETLGAYGGLAAAFLNEGFRGFVAPLWAVNDKLAHDIAVKFYQQTLDQQQPVAEALRTQRREYEPNAPVPSSTHLAYVFYGHPDLVLERQ